MFIKIVKIKKMQFSLHINKFKKVIYINTETNVFYVEISNKYKLQWEFF